MREGSGKASPVISEIPLTCPHCGKVTVKTVDWVQQNTFFTCACCSTAVMIDKDMAAQLLAQLELAQRR
jgi:transcription elongation factor Elf1